jgi:hypothetical protein
MRVGDFAKLWIESKTLALDDVTCDVYTEALESHVLPALGDYYFDALRPADVQGWVNDSLKTIDSRGKPYSVSTVHRWYRCSERWLATP